MRWDPYNENCPTRIVLDRVADKRTVLIVGALEGNTKRFGELRREIGGVRQGKKLNAGRDDVMSLPRRLFHPGFAQNVKGEYL